MSDSPRQFGPLRVFRQIGQGGMGAVYSGFDLEAKEFVAIKTLFRDLCDEEMPVELFSRECEVSASVEHTNVVRHLRHGEEDGLRFLGLEYVRGTTVRSLLDTRERLPPVQVVEIMEDCASALAHIHKKGIVHRDVKPENVIINQDGVLKLIDFGVAKLGIEDPFEDEGRAVGTSGYAAPEQNQGGEVAPSADLYALGALAWNALTGTRWIRGNSAFEAAMQQMSERPPNPSTLAPGIPAKLDAIVLRLMEPDTEERYSGADEVLEHLRAFRDEEEQKGGVDNIFADPLASKWSVAKRSFYERRYALSKSLARYLADRRPNFAPVHFLLGKLFALEAREFNSTESFRKAMELDPGNLEYRADFGLSLYRLNMFSLARTEVGILAAEHPQHPLGTGFLEVVEEALERERPPEAPEAPAATLAELRDADRDMLAGRSAGAPLGARAGHPDPTAATGTDAPGGVSADRSPREADGARLDPGTIRRLSSRFPGLGRFSMGDVGGGIQAMGLALLLLGLLGSALFLPRAPAEGWTSWFEAWSVEQGLAGPGQGEFYGRALVAGFYFGRFLGAVLALLTLVWHWRRETRAAHLAAIRKAWSGDVLEVDGSGRLRTNLGSDWGVQPGVILEVFRPIGSRGKDFVLGAVRIEASGHSESLGEFRPEVGVTDAPEPGDRLRPHRSHLVERSEGP